MKAEPIELIVKIEVNGDTVKEQTMVIPIKVEVAKPQPKLKGFRIWYEGIKNDDSMPILRLIDEDATAEPTVFVVDESGSKIRMGRLLTILKDGSFRRRGNVHPDVPIQRDLANCIIESREG